MEEINKIKEQFHNVLKSYETDMKFGQMSVESICHLFPGEIQTLLNYIEELEKCYCNRSDCSARIKDSKKYPSLQENVDKVMDYIDNQKFKNRHYPLKDVKTLLNGGELEDE